jgi:YhcH/YjgK/YiaL family protein
MIVDHLARAERYRGLSAGIAAALDFLRTTDLTAFPEGKTLLNGDRLIANVARYRTKLPEAAVWESHRKYIDVQYVVSGCERFGYVDLAAVPAVVKDYHAEKDVIFYAPGTVTLPLPAGYFAIFFPEDIHAPSLAEGEPGDVVKVVMKVAVD